jgi:hypothetical protein
MTMITGNAITLFQLLAVRGAVKLEALGMKASRGINATRDWKRHYGVKTREEVLARLEQDIAAAKAAVRPGEITA